MEKSLKKKVLTGKIISLYGEDKTGFEIFLSPFFLAIWSSGCVCMCKEGVGGIEKAHHWLADAFLSFCNFPIFWFSNFGHVTKFFLFLSGFSFFFLFPPSSLNLSFHSGIIFRLPFFSYGERGREMKKKIQTKQTNKQVPLRSETVRDAD